MPAPFIWGLYDGEDFEHFATGAEVVKRLEQENCLVYAHNGGKFDYHYLRADCARYCRIISGETSALKHSGCAPPCGAIRRKLFKIGALVTISVRRIKFAMASGCPYKAIFASAHRVLCAAIDTT